MLVTGELEREKARDVSEPKLQLRDYRLTTAEIIYHLPDHPALLQSFVWQNLDLAPEPIYERITGKNPLLAHAP